VMGYRDRPVMRQGAAQAQRQPRLARAHRNL
jgi:hypothetical protein